MNTCVTPLVLCLCLIQTSPTTQPNGPVATSQRSAERATAAASRSQKSPPSVGPELDLKVEFEPFDAAMVVFDPAANLVRRYQPAKCAERLSPCSTFKVPHALLALDLGVLSGAEHEMKWDGVRRWNEDWNRDLTLRDAMRLSALWYFQRVAPLIGRERMETGLKRLNYGNVDCSGELTQFWINGTLTISADEQLEFMNRLRTGELPVSPRAIEMTRELIIVRRDADIVIRGKTGTRAGGVGVSRADLGWFVGWAESKQRTLVFAANIRAEKDAMGPTCRDRVIRIVAEMLRATP